VSVLPKVRRLGKPVFLLALAGIFYVIATTSGAGWLYVVAAALGATVVVCVPTPLYSLPAHNLTRLDFTRTVPTVGRVGEPLSCSMEVRNGAALGRYLLEVEDRFAGGSARGVVARVRRGEPEVFRYDIETPQRGIYTGGEASVESSAPFGLFTARRKFHLASECVVYPRVFDVAGLPRPAPTETAEAEREEASMLHRGLGGEFWGVREYRPGDPARLIAWRQSARSLATGRLSVVELARETDPPFVLTMNLDPHAPAAAREMIISAGASLLLAALREGREVAADAGPQRLPFPEHPDPDSVLLWCAGLTASRPPNRGDVSVEVIPSLRAARAGGAGVTVLVSCAEFAGHGPWWMEVSEEREFVESVERSGRISARLGPEVTEPWRLT
jgi:uncharacterized protein (DUF58 family)